MRRRSWARTWPRPTSTGARSRGSTRTCSRACATGSAEQERLRAPPRCRRIPYARAICAFAPLCTTSMPWSWLEAFAGICLAYVTLRDVFETVVVPGSTHGLLKISRRMVLVTLPVAKRLRRKGVGVNFAPIVLVASFMVWMLLLVLGFALMAHACADAFTPRLRGFGHAMYVAGGAMTTMGFGRTEPSGLAAVVTVAASFCGLAVMTLAVTYLLEVQSNISHRDTGVLNISTSAGHPPTAVALLERYAALGNRDELQGIVRNGRDWCATVLQSHASHPSLIYFRSAGTGSGWPATLGVLVDMALIFELVLDEPDVAGSGVLMRDQAVRLARAITELLKLAPAPLPDVRGELQQVCVRLATAGYRLRDDIDAEGFARRRQEDVGGVEALARHLGLSGSPLLPPA